MHKKIRGIIYILFFVILLTIAATLNGKRGKVYSHNDTNKGFNVLVLNSYHQGYKWESSILKGLDEYIEENSDCGINFKIEYLDFRNNYNEKYIDSLKKMLKEKYPKGSIDAIYTVNDEAYEVFYKDMLDKESNFYKVPLLFSGVDYKESGNKEEKEYMAGIYHGDDSLSLMNMIMELSPNVKNINLIIEDSRYGESVKAEIDNLIDTYLKDEMKVNYIKSNYIQDIYNKLKNLEDNNETVNIIAGEFQYKNSKKYIEPKDAIKEIRKYTKRPIYSNDPSYMHAGIVGGYMDIGGEHAKIICGMIASLKKGINIRDIENTVEPRANGFVDYNSIYEYNINPLNVGKDVNIINKKVYEFLIPTWCKKAILVILVIFITIGIIGIKFLSKNRKRKQEEKEEIKIAKEREKLKSDFIVNLSHELRTPINVILGISKVLECSVQKGNLDENYLLNKLESINLNSYRLLKISNNIIDMTKAESGMLKLNLETCNIVSIVEEVFDISVEVANKKNIYMTFDTVCEEIKTAVDIVQIRRVILNLLSNAIKFTPEAGNINLFIWKNLDNIVIEVVDSGVGIPKEKLNEIFHSFYQIENLYTRSSEGSGIGLSIIKEIVQMHGGKIEVESEVVEVSIFRIYIPINLENNIPDYNPYKIEDIKRMVELEMSDI